MEEIAEFRGRYGFLSNFHSSVVWAGRPPISYPTVEHAYQALKTVNPDERAAFAEVKEPGTAKKMGRRVTMRPDWEVVKFDVMAKLLRQKFKPGSELAMKLMATGDALLIEGNVWGDRVWGCVKAGTRWEGQNHLGKELMQIRDELRRQG